MQSFTLLRTMNAPNAMHALRSISQIQPHSIPHCDLSFPTRPHRLSWASYIRHRLLMYGLLQTYAHTLRTTKHTKIGISRRRKIPTTPSTRRPSSQPSSTSCSSSLLTLISSSQTGRSFSQRGRSNRGFHGQSNLSTTIRTS